MLYIAVGESRQAIEKLENAINQECAKDSLVRNGGFDDASGKQDEGRHVERIDRPQNEHEHRARPTLENFQNVTEYHKQDEGTPLSVEPVIPHCTFCPITPTGYGVTQAVLVA
ncbi:hypothetical protein [Sphingomonas zeae]